MNQVSALNVELPRGRFKVFLEKPSFDFLSVNQVHSIELLNSETPDLAHQSADGIIVTATATATYSHAGPALAIKTADCLPVVVLGKNGYAAIHAGWRGLAGDILASSKLKVIEPEYFFIGPYIHVCCYSVSDDFKETFNASTSFQKSNNQLFLDLGHEARQQILKAYPQSVIEISSYCTLCDNKFHSFRRDKTTSRNWNVYIP